MPSNVFRFDETWDLPDARVADVYEILARGELLPQWWKGAPPEDATTRRKRRGL